MAWIKAIIMAWRLSINPSLHDVQRHWRRIPQHGQAIPHNLYIVDLGVLIDLIQLLAHVRSKTSPVNSTQVPALDVHFSSTDHPSHVIEIQGGPSSGKTHLLYHLLLVCITPPVHNSTALGGWGKAAIVFDMDHNFNIIRFNQLLLARLTRLLAGDNSTAKYLAQRALNRLHLFRPASSSQLAVTILHLPDYHSTHLADEEIGIVAIDSISAHYWPDRFAVEQLRRASMDTERRKETQNHTPPLEYVLSALESFRRTHGPAIVMTNWGLHSGSDTDPPFYRQHLHPFPAPFPHSYPTTTHHNTNVVSTCREGLLDLTCHITLYQDTRTIINGLETDEAHTSMQMVRRILGCIRTPNISSVSKFTLCIAMDEITSD